MDLNEAKELLKSIEEQLPLAPFTEFSHFERDGRTLHVALTERLRKAARKEGIWRSKEMLITLKNAAYGLDDANSRSHGGRDGIYLLDRSYKPVNAMMVKLFDRFLDKPDSEASAIAAALSVEVSALLPVRLVSHHMRLLGVFCRQPTADWLVLVDCDRSE